MDQPVQQSAVGIYAHAHARADGDIDSAVHSLRRAPGHLSQHRAVHVRIKAHRHAQGLLERTYDIAVLPARLGCLRDVAIGGGLLIQVKGAEASDAQRFDVPVLIVAYDVLKRFLRLSGRERDPVLHNPILITDRTYHFRAAGLDSSNQHICSSLTK